MRPPFRFQFDAAMDPQAARNALGIVGTGGSGGAPTTAEYITGSTDATLTNERVLTNTATITWDFSTPGQAKANSAAGGGNVSTSGTITTGDLARWASATTIQSYPIATLFTSPALTGTPTAPTATAGTSTTQIATTAFVATSFAPIASPTFTGDPKAPTPATGDNDTSIATTAFVKAQGYVTGGPFQAQDAELTALAGLTSAADQVPYFTGSGTASTMTVTSAARTVLDDTTVGAMLTTLGGQPLDADLTALAGISGVQGDIIYRDASSWTRLGAGTSGQFLQTQGASANPQWATLAGGGNVSNSGTPTSGQYAKWVTSTTIQGVSAATVLSDIGAQAADADLTSWAGVTRASGFDTWAATPNSANLRTLVTDETGSGALVFATSPTLVTPILGTPTSGTLTNCTGLPTILAANEATDTTCFPAFFTAATGELGPKTNANLTYNSSTGAFGIGTSATLTAGTFELGAASDTTLSRSAAGTLAIEGVNVPTDKTTPAPQCGRLTYVSTTQVKFAPYNGDRIKINGVIYAIPAAGIAGMTSTGVYVDGVAGQNLAAGGTYNVYAFNNGGTITADFVGSATAHVTSTTAGNVGTEIKSGDDTRTLIGKVIMTSGTAQFADSNTKRFVLSWFNRLEKAVRGATTSSVTTTSTGWIELSSAARAEFINWGEDTITVYVSGIVNNNTTGQACYTAFGLDAVGPSTDLGTFIHAPNINYSEGTALSDAFAVSEGYHFLTPIGAVTAGTGQWTVAVHGIIRG